MEEEEGKNVALAREGDNGPADVSTTVEDVFRGDWDHVAQELAADTHDIKNRGVGRGKGGGGLRVEKA